MKRIAWLSLLPLIAFAGVRQDYARQWPLNLDRDGEGAYRVVLDREVYRSAHLPTLADVDVVNADGSAVPAALFAAEQPLALMPRSADLPWFPLPAGKAGRAQDIAVISERAPDGSVRRVETRLSAGVDAPGAANAWLIDASRIREPLVALELDWPQGELAIDAAYRVEGSDDLRDWRELQPRVQLLDLVRGGQRLRQNRIELDGSARYLRLLPLQETAMPVLSSVRGELRSAAQVQDWRWEVLDGRSVVEKGATYYEYDLGGRFPLERADVAVLGNDANEWTLQSRDTADAPWRTRAGPWVVFSVDAAGRADRSAPQALQGVLRDRYWRLSARAAPGLVPKLRLGYRPEVVVFLAQGKPPYALLAGSARAKRSDAPLAQMLDAMRAQRGGSWRPGSAVLGQPQVSGGEQALAPAPVKRDWKAWLLWAVLIGGAAIVAAFAFSLLRRPNASS